MVGCVPATKVSRLISCGLLFGLGLAGCGRGSELSGNVSIDNVSTETPHKDEVVVSVEVLNGNASPGYVTVAAEVNCGTVSWQEKQEKLFLETNSKATATIRFKGVPDRIHTMSKEFQYQVRLYGPNGKVIEETEKRKGSKPYGPPD